MCVLIVVLSIHRVSGTLIRVQGCGVPKFNEPALRGDHYLKIHVHIPSQLGPLERELMQRLRKERFNPTQSSPLSAPSSTLPPQGGVQKERKHRRILRMFGL